MRRDESAHSGDAYWNSMSVRMCVLGAEAEAVGREKASDTHAEPIGANAESCPRGRGQVRVHRQQGANTRRYLRHDRVLSKHRPSPRGRPPLLDGA